MSALNPEAGSLDPAAVEDHVEQLRQLSTGVTDAAQRLVDTGRAVQTELTAAVEMADRVGAAAEVLAGANRDAIIEALQTMRSSDDPEMLRVARGHELDAQPKHKHLPLLLAVVRAGIPAWVHGESSSGKSTGGEQVADILDLPFRSTLMGPSSPQSQLLGYNDAGGTYHPTGLRLVSERGGLFLFDEIDNGHPSTLTVMNGILGNGHGEFPDGRIAHHPNARFMAAANTLGKGATSQYVGRNVIDAATLDRFAFIPWDIDEGLEEAIVLGNPKSSTPPADIALGGVPTPAEWLATVRAHRTAVQELGLNHMVSVRAATFGARLIQLGVGRTWLKEMLIFKGTPNDQRTKIAARAGRA